MDDEIKICTSLESKFRGMKNRCYNPKCKDYKYWGGRGITICDEWLNDPLVFCEWALENGYKLGLSIDRIDGNKGYSPENCRWVTMEQNTRWQGGTMCEPRRYSATNLYYKAGRKIDYETIKSRIRWGWDEERIISTPVKHPKITDAVLARADGLYGAERYKKLIDRYIVQGGNKENPLINWELYGQARPTKNIKRL